MYGVMLGKTKSKRRAVECSYLQQSTGSGKTSQSVIPMINRDMTNLDIGITVLEPKGKLNCRLNSIITKELRL